jgi:hypothetical protein
MAKYETVAKLMTAMSANYVNYKLTKEAIAFNTKILSDIPDDILEAATIDICSRPGAFFPSVGDWRQKALDIKFNKSGIPSAYEAWEELRSMIGKTQSRIDFTGEQDEEGRWYTREIPGKQWENKIAERVAMQLGWPEFPNGESMSYERHAFIEAYEDACRRIDYDARTLPDVKQITQGYTESAMKQLSEGMTK